MTAMATAEVQKRRLHLSALINSNHTGFCSFVTTCSKEELALGFMHKKFDLSISKEKRKPNYDVGSLIL